MPRQPHEWLIVVCVSVILTGLALDLHDPALYGYPLLLVGGAGLAGALVCRGRVFAPATTVGFLIAAAAPIAFGIYGVAHHIAYANSHPDEGLCGMPMCSAFAFIFIIGPSCGLVGAAVVAITSAIYRLVKHRLQPPVPPVV